MSQNPQSETTMLALNRSRSLRWLDLGLSRYISNRPYRRLIWWIFQGRISTFVNRWISDSSLVARLFNTGFQPVFSASE
jgi:hypothetical protein